MVLTKDREEGRKPAPSILRSCGKKGGNAGPKEEACLQFPLLG